MADGQLRWTLADEPQPQATLFEDPIFEREPGRGEFRGMEFLHVRAKRIINRVKGAPFGFEYTINAYRGCSHACVYCFARPTHAYLDLEHRRATSIARSSSRSTPSSGCEPSCSPRKWGGDLIAMGTNTDPYQRCEGKYRLTRGIIETLIEHDNPFSILTKSTLVLRDKELLAEAASARARPGEPVDRHARRRRVEDHRARHAASAATGARRSSSSTRPASRAACSIAPILPGPVRRARATRRGHPRRARDAGAVSITRVMLHLRPGVKEVFFAHLAQTHPHLVEHYRRLYGTRTHLPRSFRRSISPHRMWVTHARTARTSEDQLQAVVERGQVELDLAGLAADLEEPLHAVDGLRVEQRAGEEPLLCAEAGHRIGQRVVRRGLRRGDRAGRERRDPCRELVDVARAVRADGSARLTQPHRSAVARVDVAAAEHHLERACAPDEPRAAVACRCRRG